MGTTVRGVEWSFGQSKGNARPFKGGGGWHSGAAARSGRGRGEGGKGESWSRRGMVKYVRKGGSSGAPFRFEKRFGTKTDMLEL